MELSPPAAVHLVHKKIFVVAGAPHAAMPGKKTSQCAGWR
jgi:hypothetical protein